MTSYRIVPELRTVALRMQFLAPVAHGDSGQRDTSNRTLFHRERRVVSRETVATGTDVSDLITQFPVPARFASLYDQLSEDEFLAVALIYEFMSAYSTADGIGLFSGPERYRRLVERAAQWAVRSHSLFHWWGGLANDLQVGLPLFGDGLQQAALFGMPAPVALRVLKTLAENATSAVMLARVWREAVRDNEQMMAVQPTRGQYQTRDELVLEVPTLSANSIRHEMVREPGALHLLSRLQLRFEDLPAAVATLLYNAGDLSTTAPDAAYRLAREIRARYPLLGLLSGTTNGFILGASNLEVSSWLVAIENQRALERYGLQARLSLFDLLDEASHARHTQKRVDGSPMPFSFETLAAGTEALVEFRLRPYATVLEFGALLAALHTYFGADSTLFGQSARGYGLAVADWLAVPDGADEALALYETYLLDNDAELRRGLLEGTLGTDRVVLA